MGHVRAHLNNFIGGPCSPNNWPTGEKYGHNIKKNELMKQK